MKLLLDCSNLKNIVIKSTSLKKIGKNAFNGINLNAQGE